MEIQQNYMLDILCGTFSSAMEYGLGGGGLLHVPHTSDFSIY